MKDSKLLSLAISLFTALLVVSGCIAVPILCRPFYYIHIYALHLPEETGFSAQVIRGAYDEMLNFCTIGTPFGTGELLWSTEGMSHFADCARLFRLDFAVLLVSLGALLACRFLCRSGKMTPHRFWGRGPGFWAGGVLILCFLALTVFACTDFYRAFVLFHSLFFPGKTNWILDYKVDQIILILPQVFFRNCAILIVALLLLCCILLMALDFPRKKANV